MRGQGLAMTPHLAVLPGKGICWSVFAELALGGSEMPGS